jgi:UDP-N-acetylmuramoyl-tripeptide--D-alanyl-D-alanine ligase
MTVWKFSGKWQLSPASSIEKIEGYVKELGMPQSRKYDPQLEAATDFGYGFSTVQNPAWNLEQVVQATGGRVLNAQAGFRFRSVTTDSRLIEPGDLFLALKGEKFDGHDFLQLAVQKGAVGLVVEREPDFSVPVAVVLVDDTLQALGDLAAYRRSIMPELLVLAITGSSGKTTVKEMTAAIFAQRFVVLKTKGNFNNLVGLPLSLLPVAYRHKVAVLEMGMNRPGEIARLTEIANPDLACIVNVQEAHLEGLGSIGGVARAKGELFAGIKSSGKIVVNLDDPEIRKLAMSSPQQQITFGLRRQAQVRATHVKNNGEQGMTFTLHIGAEKTRVKLGALGGHNVMNSLAAAALAYGSGLSLTEIAQGLQAVKAYDKRL